MVHPKVEVNLTTGTKSAASQMVRAAVFDGPDAGVRLAEVGLAAPGPGEVIVEIAAAGVCHSDLHVIKGEWPVPHPTVLGHEGAGVVTA